MCNSPTKSLRRASQEFGVSKSTIHDILQQQKWHPYKLQLVQKLTEDDPDRREEMCDWFIQQCEADDLFLRNILFSDEALFYVNGEVNKQNSRYWSENNPHWISDCKEQGGRKVMVWCGMFDTELLGPFFFDQTVTGASYLECLQINLMPQLQALGKLPQWFQQDGAPAHYAASVRKWLSETFPKWIGRRGDVEWAPRSPDLNPLDIFLWGYLKARVYRVKIRDIDHLRERIGEECALINGNVEMLRKVQDNFLKRCRLCVASNGEHVEHVL